MDHDLKRCSLNYELSLFNRNPRESSILKGTGNRRAKKANSFLWHGQRSQKYSKQIKGGLVDHSNFEAKYLNK